MPPLVSHASSNRGMWPSPVTRTPKAVPFEAGGVTWVMKTVFPSSAQ